MSWRWSWKTASCTPSSSTATARHERGSAYTRGDAEEPSGRREQEAEATARRREEVKLPREQRREEKAVEETGGLREAETAQQARAEPLGRVDDGRLVVPVGEQAVEQRAGRVEGGARGEARGEAQGARGRADADCGEGEEDSLHDEADARLGKVGHELVGEGLRRLEEKVEAGQFVGRRRTAQQEETQQRCFEGARQAGGDGAASTAPRDDSSHRSEAER
eukprot:5519439-Prymnesium_polylepis.2